MKYVIKVGEKYLSSWYENHRVMTVPLTTYLQESRIFWSEDAAKAVINTLDHIRNIRPSGRWLSLTAELTCVPVLEVNGVIKLSEEAV